MVGIIDAKDEILKTVLALPASHCNVCSFFDYHIVHIDHIVLCLCVLCDYVVNNDIVIRPGLGRTHLQMSVVLREKYYAH